ncbi:MAG: 16S rRNA (uracil(1498)-N(3))-methyltransferase [Halieaceae bacterium]|nr:16S rRNA (uracil(1498)-N(3))-methyltransferase [Halieaceae bacterium]
MNLLLFDSNDMSGENEIIISGRRLKHLNNILKLKTDEQVDVGKVGGLLGKGRIISINEDEAKLDLNIYISPPEKLPLSLIIGLPRPKMLSRILRNVAAAGVKSLHLINSRKVEKSYWQSPLLQIENIHKQFKTGLEQARDTILPDIKLWQQFKPFVEDFLPNFLSGQRNFIAHPGNYPLLPADSNIPTTIALGPEGGFIPYEIEKLIDAGCAPVSLGTRVLRLESAIDTVIGRQLIPQF